MSFEARAFQLAKDPEHPAENQDAFAFDPEQGIAAVADGVASAIFSAAWAEILVHATVRQRPELDDTARFTEWLADCRRRWSEQIDTTGLAWFQKAKLPTGAFSTLLWAELSPLGSDQAGSFGGLRLVARAIGDSCLFHIRHGELLRCFPMTSAAEFANNPLALGSVDLGRDALMKFATLDVTCYPDDHLLLATDAIAEWLYRRVEANVPPDWSMLCEASPSQWLDQINALRASREMRYDDATLLALRITGREQPETAIELGCAPAAQSAAMSHDATSEKPIDAMAVAPPSPTKAAMDQIADGFTQLADESARASRALFDRLRDRFRRP